VNGLEIRRTEESMAPQHDTGTYKRAFDLILEAIEFAR
jgi:hypothetical protein